MKASTGAIVLAAGKGTRMRSAQAKVLHRVFYRPMLHHVLDAVFAAGVERVAVVVGHQREAVRQSLEPFAVQCVLQEEQRGTGHAVLCAEAACAGLERTLILCGDTPLVGPEPLAALLDAHLRQSAELSLMSTCLENPFGYGRVLRDQEGRVRAIVEEKDADAEERAVREINAGIYVVDAGFLFGALARVGTDNSQNELYLTDIVAMACREGRRLQACLHPRGQDMLGVNSRVELAQAEAVLQQRRNQELMLAGVTMLCPTDTRVAPDSQLGPDCILHGQVCIEGRSRLGRGCVVEQGVLLRDCRLGDGVRVGANSVLLGCQVADGTEIPPLTRGMDGRG